jgi:hypothetical protein
MFVEDTAAFFTDFAEAAVWNGTKQVDVNFDPIPATVLSGDVTGYEPMAQLDAASAPGLAVGDTLLLRGVNYAVVNLDLDTTGRILTVTLAER